MAGKISTVRWTVERASGDFDIDRRTLSKRIKTAGIEPGSDGKFSTTQIASAVFGDYESERVRKTRAEADLAELERDEKQRRLVPADAVSRVWDGIMIGMRETISRMKITPEEKVAALNEMRALNVDDYFTTPAADAEDD